MTDLESALNYWSHILGLGNWTITASFAHRHEMDFALADCNKRENLSQATIRIAFPDECESEFQDWEQALVHELLHVRYWNSKHEGIDNTIHEQAIDKTATALVTLKRAGSS